MYIHTYIHTYMYICILAAYTCKLAHLCTCMNPNRRTETNSHAYTRNNMNADRKTHKHTLFLSRK